MKGRGKRKTAIERQPWTQVRLSQLTYQATERLGDRDPSPYPTYGVDRTKGLTGETRYSSNNLERYKLIEPGMFAYNPMRLNIGSIAYCSRDRDPGLVSPDYVVFGCCPESLDPDFMHHVTGGSEFRRWTRRVGFGSVRIRIYYRDLGAMTLSLPPLPEQRAIASVLGTLDEAIRKAAGLIGAIQTAKTAVMSELVSQGMPGRHTSFKMTVLGEVPADWEMVDLQDVATVQTGIAKNKKAARKNGHALELPYLRVANVQDGHVDLSEVKSLLVDSRAISRHSLRAGDVLFTEGGDEDKLGRGCVWRGQIEPCLHQNHVFVVRPDKGRLLPDFLSAYRATPRAKHYFLACAKRTTNLASINSSQLKAFRVPLPTLAEQREIADVGGTFDRRLAAEGAFLRQLQEVRHTLAEALLTGDVRVPDALIADLNSKQREVEL